MIVLSRVGVLALLVHAAAACAPATMKVPGELAAAERAVVTGRGGFERSPVEFAEFKAVGLDRSWTRGSGVSAGGSSVTGAREKGRQTYGFRVLSGEREVTSVSCEARAFRQKVGLPSDIEIDISSRAGLECHAPEGSRLGAWTLLLDSKRDRPLQGYLAHGDDSFDVAAQATGSRLMPGETRGFVIRRGDAVVAAVETVNAGAVWLEPSLTAADRDLLAGAALALLLYQQLDPDA